MQVLRGEDAKSRGCGAFCLEACGAVDVLVDIG